MNCRERCTKPSSPSGTGFMVRPPGMRTRQFQRVIATASSAAVSATTKRCCRAGVAHSRAIGCCRNISRFPNACCSFACGQSALGGEPAARQRIRDRAAAESRGAVAGRRDIGGAVQAVLHAGDQSHREARRSNPPRWRPARIPDHRRPHAAARLRDPRCRRARKGFGSGTEPETVFEPFYASTRSHLARQAQGVLHAAARTAAAVGEAARAGPRSSYIGSEVFMSLVDADQAPYSSSLRQLALQVRAPIAICRCTCRWARDPRTSLPTSARR